MENVTAETQAGEPHYARQPPEIEGALVALNPHSGRVLAIQGGFNYARTEFNRATQALGSRARRSSLSSIWRAGGRLYPSSILLDAPIVIDQGGAG